MKISSCWNISDEFQLWKQTSYANHALFKEAIQFKEFLFISWVFQSQSSLIFAGCIPDFDSDNS